MGTYVHESIPRQAGWWFPLQTLMWEFYRDNECGSECICVTWDKNKTASKAFGIFKSAQSYFQTISDMPAGQRCGYEIIVEKRPCKLYLDVEWGSMGADANALVYVGEICQAITTKLQSMPGRQEQVPGFYLSTCSRPVKPKLPGGNSYKNSFHIVVMDVVFENNHDGTMRQFVQELGFADKIDKAVYTRNRSMRTELAAKMGEHTPFRSIAVPWVETTCPPLPSENEGPLVPAEEEGVLSVQTVQRLARSLISHNIDLTLRRIRAPAASPVFSLGSKRGLDAGDVSVSSGKKSNRGVRGAVDVAGGHVDTKLCMDHSEAQRRSENSQDSSRDAWAIPAYIRKLFTQENTSFRVDKVESADRGMPLVVSRLLESKSIRLQDVRFVYITHPSCCVTRLMKCEDYHHHSNNTCAFSVLLRGKVLFFAKCYGCPQDTFGALAKMDPKLDVLPCLRTNTHFHTILHSPYGLDGVADGAERRRAIAFFQKISCTLRPLIAYDLKAGSKYAHSGAFIMDAYVMSAARGWILLSPPLDSLSTSVSVSVPHPGDECMLASSNTSMCHSDNTSACYYSDDLPDDVSVCQGDDLSPTCTPDVFTGRMQQNAHKRCYNSESTCDT